MADTFTPSGGSAYSFNQDPCDNITGILPRGFTASYTTVQVAPIEGDILLENQGKGASFNITYELFDSLAGGSGVTALGKYDALFSERGKIGLINKGGVGLDGVALLDVSPPSTTTVGFKGSIVNRIECTVSFRKVD
jgi:hypothetical protein